MTEEQDKDPLTAAAEEARRLFDALQRRVGREVGKGFVRGAGSAFSGGRYGGGYGGGRAGTDVWEEAVSGHDDDEYICTACPVCRMKAARRGAQGDVTDHLISAGGELIAAFRQVVDAFQRPPAPRSPSDGPRDGRVERIDIGPEKGS
ncbi:hypothetical protein J5X84_05755 [Streptosporangiaceae bacterium NEAU-GS5]|nr:hypothetical protein [Streptosporangiaceae bacterium NEAU-GS5]